MKKVIINLMVLSVIFFSACNKNKKKIQTNLKGYIYNSNDSTPFRNTQFKFYLETNSPISAREVTEDFFYTDEEGRFDLITEMYMGSIVWPSFHEGAAYVGPGKFGNVSRSEPVNDEGIRTAYYDTLYTTPYR